MNKPDQKQILSAFIEKHLPALVLLGVELVNASAKEVVISAPLAKNHNDKGTAFGGSQYLLCIAASWGLVYLNAQAEGIDQPDLIGVEGTTTRKYKNKVYSTHLLRRSYREDGKVKNETLGNLSHLPDALIDLIRRSLQGETFVPLDQAFEVVRSRRHGAVQVVTTAMQRLGFNSLLATKTRRERGLVCAMVAARIIAPHTKLATTRWWHTTTLAEDFGVADATEDELYAAMDWLLARQGRIEKKLAARHLAEDSLVLYDLSSSYFEGHTCPLAKRGYNRDGKKGQLQVNYGLLTDGRGCPVSASVFEGNTADPQTWMPQITRLRKDFGLARVVMVGDRGMISQKSVDALREQEGIDWITALKSGAIRALIDQGQRQLGLFDESHLFEFTHPDYPGERLVACRNPELASVFEGNTADPQTWMPQITRLRKDFGLARVVMVGDRGMISQKSVDALREQEGIDWITALKSGAIRALIDQGQRQLGLFDESHLFEFTHPDYPGERLVACRNPELAALRVHKRNICCILFVSFD